MGPPRRRPVARNEAENSPDPLRAAWVLSRYPATRRPLLTTLRHCCTRDLRSQLEWMPLLLLYGNTNLYALVKNLYFLRSTLSAAHIATRKITVARMQSTVSISSPDSGFGSSR